MKRICGLFLTLVLVLGLCACASPAEKWQEQYDLGIRYLSEGNYEEAIIAFTAAIEIDPKRPEAYIKTAEAYVNAGDMDAAIAILEKGAQATGDGDLKAYLEKLQAGPLTVLTYQAAYEADGTPAFEIHYFYNENGYLIRSEQRSANQDGELVYSSVETWEHTGSDGDCVHTRSDGSTSEEHIEQGTWQRYTSIINICTNPSTKEEVGEDGILENWNSDPVNMLPRFDYAAYTFDEAGYPLTITTYGYEGEIIGTAVAEWTTIYPAM